jgi:amino acid permease
VHPANEKDNAMKSDIARVFLGIAVWAGVAALAVALAVNDAGTLVGMGGTFVAVLAAWALGERVVHPKEA